MFETLHRLRKPVVSAYLLMPFAVTAIVCIQHEETTTGRATYVAVLAACCLAVGILTIKAVRSSSAVALSEPRNWRQILALLIPLAIPTAIVGGFVTWKWVENQQRWRLWGELLQKGAVSRYHGHEVAWATSWPFRNVRVLESISLYDGRFTEGEVRKLRRVFPGVTIYMQPVGVSPVDRTRSGWLEDWDAPFAEVREIEP